MDNLTQADNGQYITRDKTGLELEVYNFDVKGEFFLIFFFFLSHNFAVFCYCSSVFFHIL